MAERTFLGNSASGTDTANWSGATVPVSSDVINFTNATGQALTSNIDWESQATAVDNVTMRVSKDHAGQLGTSGTPFITGDAWTIDYDGMKCPVMYGQTGTGETLTALKVRSSSSSGVVWSGAGTITSLYVVDGLLRLQGTAGVTTLYLLGPNARVRLEGDHGITTIYQQAGSLWSASSVGTVYLSGGTFNMEGDGSSEGDITTVNQSGGVLYFDADGCTIGTHNGLGGTLDLRQSNVKRTVTTLNAYYGFTGYCDDGTDNVELTTLNKYGGRVIEPASGAGTANLFVPETPGAPVLVP